MTGARRTVPTSRAAVANSPNGFGREHDPLVEVRPRADYNEAERWFSEVLHKRLDELLGGRRNALQLLRKYSGDNGRLGVLPTPPALPRDQLRLPVVEQLAWDALNLVRADPVGGPIAQSTASDGSLIEVRTFPTKYPHIVIEREDRYVGNAAAPGEITWTLRRVQNQRAQTQLNRLLDAANLALEVLRLVR